MNQHASDYTVTVGGIDFRPCSAATLAWLTAIRSPLLFGGDFSPVDFIVFAWMHAAPVEAVNMAVKSGTHEQEAVKWGAEAPPEVFAIYTPRKMRALAADLDLLFADMKTGFVPFPCPSPSKRRWSVRDWISTVRRCLTGCRRHSRASTPAAATRFPSRDLTPIANPPSMT